MSETVQATDGTMLQLSSMATTLTWSGDFVQTITVTFPNGGPSYVQTFTNNGTNIIAISQWIKA